MLLTASPDRAAADDQEDANRLIVESVRLYTIVEASKDLETKADNLGRILENLHRIVDSMSGSDHAVTLVAGEAVAGLSIPGIQREYDAVREEIVAFQATQPGAVYEYREPELYAAAIYETTEGHPFISIVTSVSGLSVEYVTVNDESYINERWTGVCWDFLGEAEKWTQVQTYQSDCAQLFPATLGDHHQIVSETVTDTGQQYSEAWDVETAYHDFDEDFGHLISFSGPLDRITGDERESVFQEHVFSAETGLITRIVSDADPETGEGGGVIEAVEYHEFDNRAVVDLAIGCSRNKYGIDRLQECICGAEFFQENLEEDELEHFAEIMTSETSEAPENSEFISYVNGLVPELEAQCRKTE